MNQSQLEQCDAELIGAPTLIFIKPMLGRRGGGRE